MQAEGCCPECGLRYGPEHIILFAWGWGPLYAKSRWPLTFFCGAYIAFGSLFPITFLIAMLHFPARTSVFAGLMRHPLFLNMLFAESAFILSIALFAILRRRSILRTMPAPVQLRLSPAGLVVRGGLGGRKLRPWESISRFSVIIQKNGEPKFFLRLRKPLPLKLSLYPIIPAETAAWIESRVKFWIAASADVRNSKAACESPTDIGAAFDNVLGKVR